MNDNLTCRKNCGACCIAPSISSAMPNMPNGKPAGMPCIHLDKDFNCLLFGSDFRPTVCGNLQASHEMCGNCREEALQYLQQLELLTQP